MKTLFWLFHTTLCWRRRKGSSISMPPSCTIHHTSMWPSVKRSPFDGKAEMFFGTSRARWAAVVSLTNSAEQTHTEGGRSVSGQAAFNVTQALFLFRVFSVLFWLFLNLIGLLSLHKQIPKVQARWPTNEVSPGLVLVSLLPVAWPGYQHSIMFQASEATGLEEVGGGITQVGGHGHLTEALHLFGLHQFTQRLERRGGEELSPRSREQFRYLTEWYILGFAIFTLMWL